MFINFANFYWRFIQSFSKIAALLIFLLKMTRLYEKLAPKTFRANNNKVVNDGGGRTNETVVNLFENKKSKKLTYVLKIKAM